MSNTHWKLTFDLEKALPLGDEESKQASGAAQGGVVQGIRERAKVQVEILKVPGQDKYCVDFKRKAGSAILFYDVANTYIEALDMCNDTQLQEEPA